MAQRLARRHAETMFLADDLIVWLIEQLIRAARRPLLLGAVILAFVAGACLCLILSGLTFRGWWQGFFQNLGVSVLLVGVVNLGILGALRGLTEGSPPDSGLALATGHHGRYPTHLG
jgi:VIT1/CCC1 family predicted Fe2+/Mn2+ transporter